MTSSAWEGKVPYIPGDGVGPEIMDVTRAVIDNALEKVSAGTAAIEWEPLKVGESCQRERGVWLPEEALATIKACGVALKGPLTTPVGGGIRSLNVAIRQALDLYASVRPVRYFAGVPSPMKRPDKMDVVIFRENTEDVYSGIEWQRGSEEALKMIDFLRGQMGVEVSPDSGLGVKPISERASKRLVRSAIAYAIERNLKSVTLMHKGNIMKFTEGAFRDWGYEVARHEFPGETIAEADAIVHQSSCDGRVIVNDRIADNMFQQVVTRPEDYSVIATPNLNGDYLADACAAQVGGLGLAPGANIGDGLAVFEAVHGTAPKYAGKDVANPCSLILSAAMMLDHLGLHNVADSVVRSVGDTLKEGVFTQDLARLAGTRPYRTKEFGNEVMRRIS